MKIKLDITKPCYSEQTSNRPMALRYIEVPPPVIAESNQVN